MMLFDFVMLLNIESGYGVMTWLVINLRQRRGLRERVVLIGLGSLQGPIMLHIMPLTFHK